MDFIFLLCNFETATQGAVNVDERPKGHRKCLDIILGAANAADYQNLTFWNSTVKPALTTASHTVWWLTCGLGVLIVGLGLVTTGGRALESARRAAALFDGVDRAVSARAGAR